jgi:hypothetical protein
VDCSQRPMLITNSYCDMISGLRHSKVGFGVAKFDVSNEDEA